MQLAPLPSGAKYDYDPYPKRNRFVIKPGLPQGDYFLKARWQPEQTIQAPWTRWSPPLRFQIHSTDENLSDLWQADHRLSLMLERSPEGAITLIDPEAEPPARSGLPTAKWFANPVYEGVTPLFNEEPEYYEDPLAYYFACIDQLLSHGAKFITWHDLLDGNHSASQLDILLQFDVDGGPRSMQRIYAGLASRGVRGTIMLHRRGHHWYPYELEDIGIDWIRVAEASGWTVGYHNNALSQVMGDDSIEADAPALERAVQIFQRDVTELRQHFNIRTFTHHGGNVYNLKVAPPADLNLTGVDRTYSPDLWKSISSMFSDGGFISRPSTLQGKIQSLINSVGSQHPHAGLHFFRNHPFKYGNYSPPVDAIPRFLDDFPKAGLPQKDKSALARRKNELEKEARWLHQRQKSRSKHRLSYLRLEKPISSHFKPFSQVESRVVQLRNRRRQTFLRLYPWSEGDPRVFWWRMLEAWAPQSGELLNVGALPPDQKDEHNRFLSPDVLIKDADIDAGRFPDFLFDICKAPASFDNRFAGTMLFGLPYFASPSKAVAACARLTKPGGVGLFGFVADTHPARGSVWHPRNRHLWRKAIEPLTDIGLKANLWAFDQESLSELFQSWNCFKFEIMGHYWFVRAQKGFSL